MSRLVTVNRIDQVQGFRVQGSRFRGSGFRGSRFRFTEVQRLADVARRPITTDRRFCHVLSRLVPEFAGRIAMALRVLLITGWRPREVRGLGCVSTVQGAQGHNLQTDGSRTGSAQISSSAIRFAGRRARRRRTFQKDSVVSSRESLLTSRESRAAHCSKHATTSRTAEPRTTSPRRTRRASSNFMHEPRKRPPGCCDTSSPAKAKPQPAGTLNREL